MGLHPCRSSPCFKGIERCQKREREKDTEKDNLSYSLCGKDPWTQRKSNCHPFYAERTQWAGRRPNISGAALTARCGLRARTATPKTAAIISPYQFVLCGVIPLEPDGFDPTVCVQQQGRVPCTPQHHSLKQLHCHVVLIT